MAKMAGKVLIKGCHYGCCGPYTRSGERHKGTRLQRRRERQNFKKFLASGQDI